MKKLIVNEIEIDVSHLTNSECYSLTATLGVCYEKVVIETDEATSKNGLVCEKEETAHYKFSSNPKYAARYANDKYEAREFDKPDNLLSVFTNKNPKKGDFEVRGLSFPKYGGTIAEKLKVLSFEYMGYTYAAESEKAIEVIKKALVKEKL